MKLLSTQKADADPASLCKTIYERSLKGMDLIIRENAPKHKDAFLKFCPTLPVELLHCEADDMSKMSDDRMKKCMKLKSKHRGSMNKVLLTGKPK